MTRQFLKGIRVSAKQELVARIYKYFEEVNATPVVYHWKYRMDEFDPPVSIANNLCSTSESFDVAPFVNGRLQNPCLWNQNAVDGAVSPEQTVKLHANVFSASTSFEAHRKEIETEILKLSEPYYPNGFVHELPYHQFKYTDSEREALNFLKFRGYVIKKLKH